MNKTGKESHLASKWRHTMKVYSLLVMEYELLPSSINDDDCVLCLALSPC